MSQKLKLDDKEYDISDLSENSKKTLASLQFATKKLQELDNMRALLQRAKNSYMESLKKEMLSQKAGYLFDDE